MGFPLFLGLCVHTYKMHKFNKNSGCPNFVIFFPLLKSCLNLGNLDPIQKTCSNSGTLSQLWYLFQVFEPCSISVVWSKFLNIESILENCQNSKSDTIFEKSSNFRALSQILELCPNSWLWPNCGNLSQLWNIVPIMEHCPNYGTLSA